MNKMTKKFITICAIFSLTLSIAVPTVFAASRPSVATLDYGRDVAKGGERTLSSSDLYGYVESTTDTSVTAVEGSMYTAGAVFDMRRDYGIVDSCDSDDLHWANPDGEVGLFWAECEAVDGNHSGYCEVYQ